MAKPNIFAFAILPITLSVAWGIFYAFLSHGGTVDWRQGALELGVRLSAGRFRTALELPAEDFKHVRAEFEKLFVLSHHNFWESVGHHAKITASKESIAFPGLEPGDAKVEAHIFRPNTTLQEMIKEDRSLLDSRMRIPPRRQMDASSGKELMPALVFYHGGGWAIGGGHSYDGMYSRLSTLNDIVLIAVEYRMAPEFLYPTAINEAKAALRATYQQSKELGVDPNRIYIGGDSAGGNLAAATAHWARDQHIPLKGQILLYPALDYTASQLTDDSYHSWKIFENGFPEADDVRAFWETYLPKVVRQDPQRSKNVDHSPLLASSMTGLAPTLIVSSPTDVLLSESVKYESRLKEANVPVRRHEIRAPHGFFANRLLFERENIELEFLIKDFLDDPTEATKPENDRPRPSLEGEKLPDLPPIPKQELPRRAPPINVEKVDGSSNAAFAQDSQNNNQRQQPPQQQRQPPQQQQRQPPPQQQHQPPQQQQRQPPQQQHRQPPQQQQRQPPQQQHQPPPQQQRQPPPQQQHQPPPQQQQRQPPQQQQQHQPPQQQQQRHPPLQQQQPPQRQTLEQQRQPNVHERKDNVAGEQVKMDAREARAAKLVEQEKSQEQAMAAEEKRQPIRQ